MLGCPGLEITTWGRRGLPKCRRRRLGCGVVGSTRLAGAQEPFGGLAARQASRLAAHRLSLLIEPAGHWLAVRLGGRGTEV